MKNKVLCDKIGPIFRSTKRENSSNLTTNKIINKPFHKIIISQYKTQYSKLNIIVEFNKE